jgi:nicotinamidase-related amidase
MTDAALLIIDMQEALAAGAYENSAVVDRIAALADRVRALGRAVIYLQHNASSGPLAKGQPGWRIHHRLEPRPGDIVIEKEASDAFYGTPLEKTLRKLRVKTVLICGMTTEYCVDATCRSALSHGFDVLLLSDCHTTSDLGLGAKQVIAHHNTVLGNLIHPTKRITPIESTEVK